MYASELDPKPLASGAYGQVCVCVCVCMYVWHICLNQNWLLNLWHQQQTDGQVLLIMHMEMDPRDSCCELYICVCNTLFQNRIYVYVTHSFKTAGVPRHMENDQNGGCCEKDSENVSDDSSTNDGKLQVGYVCACVVLMHLFHT
jgi:hypothetical protein